MKQRHALREGCPADECVFEPCARSRSKKPGTNHTSIEFRKGAGEPQHARCRVANCHEWEIEGLERL